MELQRQKRNLALARVSRFASITSGGVGWCDPAMAFPNLASERFTTKALAIGGLILPLGQYLTPFCQVKGQFSEKSTFFHLHDMIATQHSQMSP